MNWLDVPARWRNRGHFSPDNSRRLVAFCERLLDATQAADQTGRGKARPTTNNPATRRRRPNGTRRK